MDWAKLIGRWVVGIVCAFILANWVWTDSKTNTAVSEVKEMVVKLATKADIEAMKTSVMPSKSAVPAATTAPSAPTTPTLDPAVRVSPDAVIKPAVPAPLPPPTFVAKPPETGNASEDALAERIINALKPQFQGIEMLSGLPEKVNTLREDVDGLKTRMGELEKKPAAVSPPPKAAEVQKPPRANSPTGDSRIPMRPAEIVCRCGHRHPVHYDNVGNPHWHPYVNEWGARMCPPDGAVIVRYEPAPISLPITPPPSQTLPSAPNLTPTTPIIPRPIRNSDKVARR